MNAVERHGFLTHARTKRFARKIRQAHEVIAEALKLAPAFVSLSWGKDSTVLLHLAQQINPNILAVHFSTPCQNLLEDYSGIEKAYCNRFPTNLKTVDIGMEITLPEAVRRQLIWQSHPVALTGMRAEENPGTRGKHLKSRGLIVPYKSPELKGVTAAHPLGFWSWQDVWAYICDRDLPYLPSYDETFIHKSRSRTTNVMPFLGNNSASQRLGRIDRMKMESPEAYAFLQQYYPHVVGSY
jgi:3'-phosphoadenosine 5'-phosphosulfate sulfotransferase (PAPS reductase)/FAD synthetase